VTATLEALPFERIGSGKVRELYRVNLDDGSDALLLIATDRISAYDVILPQPIPQKGYVLTQLSRFWMNYLANVCPNHLITCETSEILSLVKASADVKEWVRPQIEGRATLCKLTRPVMFECVVRGYLSGSGWKEYQKTGTVCGIELPSGLRESDRLPQPIFTPATKAVSGHDENVSFQYMADNLGLDAASRLRDTSLALYSKAAEYALGSGIIIADTKFEFGVLDGETLLIDEALTPDSSRFWDATKYEPGRAQESFDKQPVRDWLDAQGWDRSPPPPPLPDEVVKAASSRYLEALRRIAHVD
jgi:phosphoribosylaminoimidazole-succinocarboxamide synthase